MNQPTFRLLAELDAARAREAKLREALKNLVDATVRCDTPYDAGVSSDSFVVEEARAALAEGEDTK